MKLNVLEEKILSKMYMVEVEKTSILMILTFVWLDFIMGLYLILEESLKSLLLVSKTISKLNLEMEYNHCKKVNILEGSKFLETLKKDLNILKKLILHLILNKIGKSLIEKTL